jgi:hypothetical protein
MSRKISFVIKHLAAYDGLLTAASPRQATIGAAVEFRSLQWRGLRADRRGGHGAR